MRTYSNIDLDGESATPQPVPYVNPARPQWRDCPVYSPGWMDQMKVHVELIGWPAVRHERPDHRRKCRGMG